MTIDQLSSAVSLATTSTPLFDVDIDCFMGFTLADYRPIVCTLLVRWQCVRMTGEIDQDALQEIYQAGRRKFQVV